MYNWKLNFFFVLNNGGSFFFLFVRNDFFQLAKIKILRLSNTQKQKNTQSQRIAFFPFFKFKKKKHNFHIAFIKKTKTFHTILCTREKNSKKFEI